MPRCAARVRRVGSRHIHTWIKKGLWVRQAERPTQAPLEGAAVVQAQQHRLGEFCQDWRAHFVATMQPAHLPHGWRIDRRDCLTSEPE